MSNSRKIAVTWGTFKKWKDDSLRHAGGDDSVVYGTQKGTIAIKCEFTFALFVSREELEKCLTAEK